MQTAPSRMRNERRTSNVKSAWPGVSIKLILWGTRLLVLGELSEKPPVGKGGQWNEMAADWIVTPRALSAGRKSVTVEPSSTSVELVRIRTLKRSSLWFRDGFRYD